MTGRKYGLIGGRRCPPQLLYEGKLSDEGARVIFIRYQILSADFLNIAGATVFNPKRGLPSNETKFIFNPHSGLFGSENLP
jgi:hypothetical protein